MHGTLFGGSASARRKEEPGSFTLIPHPLASNERTVPAHAIQVGTSPGRDASPGAITRQPLFWFSCCFWGLLNGTCVGSRVFLHRIGGGCEGGYQVQHAYCLEGMVVG